jgi:cell division protein FtsN
MAQAPGGATAAAAPAANSTTGTKKGVSVGTIVLAVIVVAILAAAVATPGLLKRRPLAQEAAATGPVVPGAGAPSAGDAVDDLREHTG